jgi:tRNA(Ile)-lysidine synthase
VALLFLLHELRPEWKLNLAVIHVNYGLRGDESDEDERFVKDLCGRLEIPCIVKRVDLANQRERGGGRSLQERAREARYRVMREAAAAERADRVALGHTADDQAETILLWLLRGAGLTGLAGMPFVREGLFIRPLLTIPRADLAAALSSRAIEFRTDSTNATLIYRRNRIRHELLPVMTSLAPSFVRLVGRQSEVLNEEDRFLEQAVTDWLPRVLSMDRGRPVLNRAALLDAPLAMQRRVVRRVLRELDPRCAAPRFSVVEAVLHQVIRPPSGARLRAAGIEIVRDGAVIRFMRQAPSGLSGTSSHPIGTVPIEIPGSVLWPGTGERIDLEAIDAERARAVRRARSKRVAVFDAATFTPTLVVRAWRPGDRFSPTGMGGKQKKLQDFFTDSKIGLTHRRCIPVLTAPEGILWVAGHRADQRFAAGSSTKAFVMAAISTHISTEGRD